MKVNDGGTTYTTKTKTTTPAKTTPPKKPAAPKTPSNPHPDIYNSSITTPQHYNPLQPAINAFQQAGHALSTVGQQVQQSYYQITHNDKSLQQVADKNGVSLEDMIAINKTKTLPPPGSYVQLHNQADQYGPTGYSVATGYTSNSMQHQQAVNEGRGDPSAQRLRNQASQIMTQLANGQAPDQIPSAALGFITNAKGQPLTIQMAQQMGYVMNNQGILVKNGAGVTGSQMIQTSIGTGSADFMNTGFMQKNLEKNIDFVHQLRWDPQKKKYVQIGQLIKEGKLDVKTGKFYPHGRNKNHGGPKGGYAAGGGGGSRSTTAPVATNAEGPQTVLDVHLGSG